MNPEIFKWIRRLLIIGLVLYAILRITNVAFAQDENVIEIEYQGQEVYLGDTINVQKVLAYGNILAFAWYEDNIYDATPDQVIEITGDQHRVYLDPNLWNVGTYFKWAGEYNRAEYPNAFVIKSGRRPEALPTASGAATPIPTATPEPAKEYPKETHVYLAQGDNITLRYFHPEGYGESEKGYIWLFNTKDTTPPVMGSPLTYCNSLYRYDFQPYLTEKLTVGWYTGYIQFTGRNRYQDVFYDYQTNSLDTPYDDKVVPDVKLDGFIPVRMQQEFEILEKNEKYCDDTLIPITMEIHEPYLMLMGYWEDEDKLIVEGNTSFTEGTNITFMIDPDRWALAEDKKEHTWYAESEGGINSPRTFRVEMKVNWDEMSIGWHTVQGSAEKNKMKADGEIQFRVTDILIMPTPTPERERVLIEQYGTHHLNSTNSSVIVRANVTPVPASTKTAVPTKTPSPVNTTVQPMTSAPTTATTKPTPRGTPTINVPLSFPTIILAIGIGLILCHIWIGNKWRTKK